jgi:hypothetical protein
MQIMSLGGSLDAPIDLAEIVHDRALRVDVAGPCLSGCASFVFVAGLERRILPGGIVALHNTSTSALMLARAGAADQNLRLGPLQRRAMRESSLYQRLRISNDLLIEPQVRLDTRCIESNGADPQTGEWRFKIYSQLGFWAPTRAQWRRFGVNMTGFMPASRRQAQRALYANLPANMRAGASLAFDNRPLSNAPAFYLSRIAMCP